MPRIFIPGLAVVAVAVITITTTFHCLADFGVMAQILAPVHIRVVHFPAVRTITILVLELDSVICIFSNYKFY